MATSQQVQGLLSAVIDGQAFLCISADVTLSSIERKGLFGLDSFHGVAEKPRASVIKMSLREVATFQVQQLNSIINSEVILNFRDGKQIIAPNCYSVDVQTINVEEGSYEITVESPNLLELTSV